MDGAPDYHWTVTRQPIMLQLFVYKCIQEPAAPEVHVLRCIKGSVFSEALDALVPTSHRTHPIVVKCVFGSYCNQPTAFFTRNCPKWRQQNLSCERNRKGLSAVRYELRHTLGCVSAACFTQLRTKATHVLITSRISKSQYSN